MKIQKLEPSKRRAGWWLVWLEDGSLVRLEEGQVVALSLYSGKELDEDGAAALCDAADRSQLRHRAVSLLSLRPMSRRELTDRLLEPPRRKKAGEEPAQRPAATPEQVQATADWLEDLGLLNDEAYARTVAAHYAAKGYGVRKLRDELYRRGLPRELWDQALAEVGAAENALDRLVGQRLRGQELTRESLKKTADFLARRGFGWEDISAALERYRREAEETGSPE